MSKYESWVSLLTKPSIGRRLAVYILLFSSVVTLASTALQLSLDYQRDVDDIETQLTQISDSYSVSMASSLWVTSKKDLKLQLDGILKLPDMQYLEVRSDNDELQASAGKITTGSLISHTFPLVFQHRGEDIQLGKLVVVATLDGVYARLKQKVLVILITQSIKTFLVSLFILYLFHILVGKYLKKIANFSNEASNKNPDMRLELERPANKYTAGDELDQLVSSINLMRQHLNAYYDELQESEFRWKYALEGGGDGVWDLDVLTNRTVYSEHFKEILGYPIDEPWATLDDWISLCNPEDKANVMNAVQDCLYGKTSSLVCEFRMRCKNGEIIWARARGMVVERDQSGRALRMIGTCADISDLKAIEAREALLNRQLLQATKMESIGHLTGGIAHDFNNILGAIIGYADLTKMVLPKDNGPYEKVTRYVGEILTAGERAKELIQQMLVFSRLSPELKEGSRQAVMVSPVVKEVVKLLRSFISASMSLNYEFKQDNLKVKIQPIHLHQILMNLGVNARDAIGEFGAINITVGIYQNDVQICSSCNKEMTGKFVDIAVSDTGEGIPLAYIHSIFDPFFTTKPVGKGTGMGLSVVHGVVHDAGGHIVVESEVGAGTTFHILLPVIEDEIALIEHTKATQAFIGHNMNGLKLLVLDDEVSMTSMLKDLLETLGATVTIFNEPGMALEVFDQDPMQFDLVITDESMPNLSGMMVAKHMLELRPNLPIILCTGYSEHASAEAVASVGISGFMFKPLDTQALIHQIIELTKNYIKHPE